MAAAERAAGGFRPVSIALWQVAQLVPLGIALLAAERGSVASLLAGAATLLGSLLLQRLAVGFALRPDRRSGAAITLLLLKLSGLLLLAYVGFETAWIAPMSFAVGATTLPVAIVLDACYGQWSSRRPGAIDSA